MFSLVCTIIIIARNVTHSQQTNIYFSLFFWFSVTDFTDFPFTSISAAASVANSPILVRRDSILKHSGSIKNNEKRVSIKHDQPAFVEYLSEKRGQMPSSVSQSFPPTQPQQSQSQPQTIPNARPASLIINKNSDKPTFKLVRSTSIEHHESIETLNAPTMFDQHSTIMMNNLNVNNFNLATTKDDDDESMPLVQIDSNGTNKIMSSQNTGNL